MKTLDHFEFPQDRAKKKLTLISSEQLRKGCHAFRKGERRDAIYKTATFLVDHFWGKACEVAEGLGVLLLVWNNAHYRHGSFDFDALEKCIAENQQLLDTYRTRTILDYDPKDDSDITALFQAFLDALQICEKKSKGKRSPVGVAKALHLLGPGFFPLWDKKIAIGYSCDYAKDPAGKYIAFLRMTKEIAEALASTENVKGRTLVKLIDEYNYAKHTKKWIT